MQVVLDYVSRFLDIAFVIVVFIVVLELKRDVSDMRAMLKRLSQPPDVGATQPKDR